MSPEKVITDSQRIVDALADHFKVDLDLGNEILKSWRLSRLSHLKNEYHLQIDETDYKQKVRDYAIALSRISVRQHAEGRDTLIAQAIHAIDELQKSFTLLGGRLYEIYALHFPELTSRIQNPATLARIILKHSNRESFSAETLSTFGISAEYVQYIVQHKDESLGANFSVSDLAIIEALAKSVYDLYQNKMQLEKWIETVMNEVAPNLTAVAGANVGARLIAHVGNLKSLAFLSSGKVQTLGAEKALYKALRFKGKTPKHGIIFQIPEVGTMPFWLRGKMARAFASKIVIAARLDVYGGSYLGPEMREKLKEKANLLRKQFPNPPKEASKPNKQSSKKNRSKRRKK